MRYEMRTMTGYSKRTMADGVRSPSDPLPMNGFGRSVVELPFIVTGEAAAALKAAAVERGHTMAQLTRLLISDFLSRASVGSPAVAVIQTKYGRLVFETKEDFISFQLDCPHSSARWVHGGHESFVCERCWAVLETGWPDDHPAISRWLNDGGSGCPL